MCNRPIPSAPTVRTYMQIANAIEYHKQLGKWALEQVGGKSISADHRTALSAACFDVAIEHHAAIATLCQQNQYGSAFALIRVLFESCVRGVWLHKCATSSELDRYKKDSLDKRFYQVLEDVEKQEGFEEGVLSNVKLRYWDVMNSYTHTGILQTSRRLSETTVGPAYTAGEVIEALGFAGSLCMFATQQVALLFGDLPLANAVLNKMRAYASVNF